MPHISGDAVPAAAALTTGELTLRDFFATTAPFTTYILPGTDLTDLQWMAKKAYEYADAMILAREPQAS